ncbi:hypothetical protein [Streptomyces sp. GMR22]|uniref:hypothetical protein n=1 Tax=Streptomyces sp. GMR22 TaxID=2759524 RepID=UPI0015FBEABD|nr:hypothetical protein [Streptomyces sp. GMR22]MBA6434340.1 hypothetical protein [Streptomyces sp. GMR22]
MAEGEKVSAARLPGGGRAREIDPGDLAHISPYLTEYINRFGEYSTHELGIEPEAYDPKLDVDFTQLRAEAAPAEGFGQAALAGTREACLGQGSQAMQPDCAQPDREPDKVQAPPSRQAHERLAQDGCWSWSFLSQ